MIKRWVVRGMAAAGLVLVGLSAWIAWYLYAPLGQGVDKREFVIEQGTTLRGVSRSLVQAGVLPDARRFELLGRVLKREGALKAGNYQLDPRWSALELLDGITGRAAAQLDRIVLVEGWTFRQFRAALDAHDALRHETTGMADAEVVQRLGWSQGVHPEGQFFPDSYYFARGASDLSIMRRAASRMTETLNRQWTTRLDDLPIRSAYDALVLASIVEKETALAVDRPMVAAVLLNRLRKGMRLQVDPTVIYGLGENFDGNLRRSDLERDTPYNTYTRAGLPPTPIAAPGLASISAVMKPARSTALYFVARGDGSSEFSDNLADHNRAVSKYQRSPSGPR